MILFKNRLNGIYKHFIFSGIYRHTLGKLEGFQEIRIIGWGVEDDINYWLIVNSWNEDWGDKGFAKIQFRDLEIEVDACAGIPK